MSTLESLLFEGIFRCVPNSNCVMHKNSPGQLTTISHLFHLCTAVGAVVLVVSDLAANHNAKDDGDHSENDKNNEETDPSFFARSPS
jgi:hypothetical protein